MNSGTIIILVIVAVIIVAALGLAIQKQAQRKRSERLQQDFGPEYDRAVRRSDGPRAAEAELLEREKRHKSLELRVLDAGQRRDYEQRWSRVQADFVDDPSRAVRDADHLVVDVMSARGYPVDDFDQRADDLSVDYPAVTERYRKARTIARANERGETDTEDMRNAVTSYRSLIDALLHDDDSRGGDSRGGREHHDRAVGGDRDRAPGSKERGSPGRDTGDGSGSHRSERADGGNRTDPREPHGSRESHG